MYLTLLTNELNLHEHGWQGWEQQQSRAGRGDRVPGDLTGTASATNICILRMNYDPFWYSKQTSGGSQNAKLIKRICKVFFNGTCESNVN